VLKHLAAATLTLLAIAAPAAAKSISVSWVGDMALSRHYGLPPGGPARALAGVRRQLRPNDLAIGNLEGTLGSGGGAKCGSSSKDCFAFQAPASYAGGYRRSGFDAVNVANNHALDFGPAGQAQTLAALRRHHVVWTGRPGQITLRRVKGVRVALLGFAPYPWASPLLNIAAAARLVRNASRRAAVVVVLIHAGAEGASRTHTPRGPELAFGENRGNPRAFAHAAVRAGADLVLGSGPHVVRGVERYRRRLIAYSLGNFLGFHTFSTGGVLSQSGILRVRVSEKGVPLRGRWVSVRLDGAGVPHLGGHSARLVRSLSRQDFGRRAYPMDSRGKL
jgi:Bacterial capsule synthesis protein PGA_cap